MSRIWALVFIVIIHTAAQSIMLHGTSLVTAAVTAAAGL